MYLTNAELSITVYDDVAGNDEYKVFSTAYKSKYWFVVMERDMHFSFILKRQNNQLVLTFDQVSETLGAWPNDYSDGSEYCVYNLKLTPTQGNLLTLEKQYENFSELSNSLERRVKLDFVKTKKSLAIALIGLITQIKRWCLDVYGEKPVFID